MLRFVQKIIRNYMNNKKKGLAQSEQVPYICKSDNYSSTAACAAAKFSLFIRDSKGLCKLFVSQNFYFATIAKCVSIFVSHVIIHSIYKAIAAHASASAKAW